MSVVYLMTPATAPEALWTFDVDGDTKRELEIEWTDKPVEDAATISEYGVSKPRQFSVSGRVTAWPLAGHDPVRIGSVVADLESIALRRQQVILVTNDFADEIVIAKVSASTSPDDGDQASITIDCRRVDVVRPETTTVPASRLKSSVRPGAAAAPKASASGTAEALPAEDLTSAKAGGKSIWDRAIEAGRR